MFSLNLGRVSVIKQLGCQIIMEEPGKCQNGITTNPIERKIIISRHGEILSTDYYNPESPTPSVCRLQQTDTTIFPGDIISVPVPENLQFTTISITPRAEYCDILEAKCVVVEKSVTMRNISSLPVNIKKHSHLADFRMTLEKHPEEMRDQVNRINLVHLHDPDKFKYLPTVKVAVPPDPSTISVDPDNIMTKADRDNFHQINQRFKERFTQTPSRYNGA